MRPIVFVAALLASSTAFGGIFTGTPNLRLEINRAPADFVAGMVEVHAVHIHHCDGQVATYPVEDTLDPVKGLEIVIDGGDLCNAEVQWSSAGYVYGPKYTLKIDTPSSTVLPFSQGANAPFTAFDVVAGALPTPAAGPRLQMFLD